MSREERLWCFWYGLFLAAITTIPYMVGLAVQGEGWRFTGFVFGVEDGNSYIAKMLLGQIGDWLFRTPYAAEPQQGVLAFLPYILLGKAAAPPEVHLQLVVLFHIFRVVCIPFTVWMMYQFISIYINDHRWRKWATVLATIGGGLGWLIFTTGQASWLGSLPLEWISPESFGFLSIYGLPHLLLARALLLFSVILLLRAEANPRLAWFAGGVTILLLFVQPLSGLTLAAVIALYNLLVLIYSLQRKKPQRYRPLFYNSLRMMIPPLPVFLYFAYVFSTDPFLQVWTSQNLILSPHIFHYLLAYGLMIPFILVTSRMRVWKRRLHWFLPIGWLLAGLGLAYFPHNLQRRLPEGIWVVIVVLAVPGMMEIWRRRPWGRVFVGLSLTFSFVSSTLLLFGGLQAAMTPKMPMFRSSAEITAFEELVTISPEHSVILASYETGNALPAWAPVQVLVGHGPESADLERLLVEVSAFYNPGWDDERRLQFLEEHQVNFVFYGPLERALGGWDPDSSQFMRRRYNREGYRIYEVTLSP